MKVVLVGSNGQLGVDLVTALRGFVELRELTHADLDVTDARRIDGVLASERPDVVINTAAFNRVDDCETHPELALAVNATGPHLLARTCQVLGIRLLHVSTDYVFGGNRARPWTEEDIPRPRSVYGISKFAGELAVRAASPFSYVVRVSGLYGLAGSRGKGGNFVETMLRLQAQDRTIRVVDDQVLAPTSTLDLAAKLRDFILDQPPAGIYHMTAAGQCSWYEFAKTLFEYSNLEVDLRRQSSEELSAPAQRPAYSVLSNERLRRVGISQIRPWSAGLADYLQRRAQRSGRMQTLVGV